MTQKHVALRSVRTATDDRADSASGGSHRLRLHRWVHVRSPWRVPELSRAPLASTPPRVHLDNLVLVDRGFVRLGGVRTVPARHSSHAVLVAAEHDLGWP